jgi:hypothetical protein
MCESEKVPTMNKLPATVTTQGNGNLIPWEPGCISPNPKGRPLGSKHRLAESFIRALAESFQQYGPETLERVRQDDPATYLRLVAYLLPKEIKIQPDQQELSSLTAEELQDEIQQRVARLGWAVAR